MTKAHWAYLLFLAVAFPGMAANSFQRYRDDGNLFSLSVSIGCAIVSVIIFFQLYKRFAAKR